MPNDKQQNEQEYTLDELSGMGAVGGAGAIEGHANAQKKKRKDMYEEFKLRAIVQEIISGIYQESLQKDVKNSIGVHTFVRNQILQEKENIDDIPHDSTGINVLAELLKKIIPILETGYKTLTSKEEQRQSFRAHILSAMESSITQADITGNAEALEDKLGESDLDGNTEYDLEEIDIEVGGENNTENLPDDEKFIDIDPKKGDNEDTDEFTISGEDQTGRDMAQISFEKIESQVIESYHILSDPEDKQLFYDYLLANLKLYFNKFENELSTNISEPFVGDEEAEQERGA